MLLTTENNRKNIPFVAVCALTGYGIDHALWTITRTVMAYRQAMNDDGTLKQPDASSSVSSSSSSTDNKGSCTVQ
jgi:hypothetical protein